MTSRLRDSIARQLRLPTKSYMGWITLQIFKSTSKTLEINAARLSNISPHHHVLEVGFGPGVGLEHSLQYLKDGPGKVCGLELSPYMLETAAARLKKAVSENKVELTYGTVEIIPYGNDTFDRVFHCNVYYFWPSVQQCLEEIKRVMKPGAMMVTVLSLEDNRLAKSRGLMKYGNPDPVKYMCTLESTGFTGVKMEYYKDGKTKYQAIFSHLPEDESDVVHREV